MVLTVAIVIPAIFLRSVIDLASSAAVYAYNYGDLDYSKALSNLTLANTYIYIITTMAIYLGLAVVGVRHPKNVVPEGQIKTAGYA